MNSVMTRFERGYGENFYFYFFCHYMPPIIQKIYQKNCLGLGVMTIEGFEHKNFTSKHALYNWSYGKGNVTLQNMKVMHLFFQSSYHNVLREIKKRVKSEKKKVIQQQAIK